MSWKKKLLKKSRLYVIIDKEAARPMTLAEAAKKISHSAAEIIQLRDKKADKSALLTEALSLRRFFLNRRQLFIINDYPDIAKISRADGVHLGQQDAAIKTARKMLGRDKIIGVSCHTLKQAQKAQKEGADYIGMGPVFETQTKRLKRKRVSLGLISRAGQKTGLPVFAIGGIAPDSLGCLSSAGINRVAASSAIFREKDILSGIKSFKNIIDDAAGVR